MGGCGVAADITGFSGFCLKVGGWVGGKGNGEGERGVIGGVNAPSPALP